MAVKRTLNPNETSEVSTGASPFETTDASPESKVGAAPKAGANAEVNVELVTCIETYDGNVERAEQSFIEMVEYIQKNEISKATVVVSLMKARNITFETAQTHYSKMKKLLNDEAVLAELKSGQITMKVAREKTTTKQKNPASAKPENKEAKYTNSLKTFVGAAKESGFSVREIMVSVEAELKSAGIK
jgi:hypothetical protein